MLRCRRWVALMVDVSGSKKLRARLTSAGKKSLVPVCVFGSSSSSVSYFCLLFQGAILVHYFGATAIDSYAYIMYVMPIYIVCMYLVVCVCVLLTCVY